MKYKKCASKPELLAPAGCLESFHAAIEAGADALYLGLNEHNARLRAKNFSIKTLSYLVPFAHKKNRKIYVTLNTLVKQNELKNIIDILYQLEQIGVDAIIIQDLGIVNIVRRYFPKLALHASTQMAIHNSIGVQIAENLGFKRVTLARECTLSEIKAIKKSTTIELEVFIHGALCYSISGLCLASSYLGGQSGNRGRCTQVCRRRFTTDNTSGFYFSPNDLCAIDFVKYLKEIGVTCFKVEGRMKGEEYVYSVVSSYRSVLDNPESIKPVKKDLQYDFGREKTQLFLASTSQKGIIDESRPPGTGILVGKVLNVRKNNIEIKTDEKLFIGDKIRLSIPDGPESFSIKITKVSQNSNKWQVYFDKPSAANEGDLVYLISRKTASQKKWSHKHIEIKPVNYRMHYAKGLRIYKKYMHLKKDLLTKKENRLYLRIDAVKWLYLLKSTPCDGVILQCEKDDLHYLKSNSKLQKQWASKLILALPPFIPQNDIPIWKKNSNDLHKIGINKWMCSQLGQKELIPIKNALYSDSSIWATNRATQQLLQKAGYSRFSYSPEDDIFNLKATASPGGLMTLFAYIPLFISRIKPPLPENTFLTDDKNFGFFINKRNGLYYLIGEKPLCLTHRRDKLNAAGIHNFILDLSFCPVNKKILNAVLLHYHNKKKIPDTTLFNHKAGLK